MYSLLNFLLAQTVGYSWGILLLGGADLLAVLTIPSVLMRRRGRPLAAMSWLLALFILPYLGFVLWWLVGRERVKRKRRLRQESAEEFSESLEGLDHARASTAGFDAFDRVLPRGLFSQFGPLQLSRPTEGNYTDLLVDGEEAFPAIEAMVERADEFVHMLFYIWNDDATGRRLRDLLVEKAREGVEVRLLVDAFGSPKVRKDFTKPLVEAGGKVGRFLPPTFVAWRPTFNFRNHRKLAVVDGREAVTGGMNVGEEYEHDWHDLGIHVRGPVVRDLHRTFLDDWLFATGENLAMDRYLRIGDYEIPPEDSDVAPASCAVFASGPDTRSNALKDGLIHAINGARERLWMMTPYFIPNTEFLTALRAAVQRGVDVRLILPARGDIWIVQRASRAYYPILFDSGVRVFEYQPRTLHAKASLVDDDIVMVGSANLDVRSFEINFELTSVIASRQLNASLAEVLEADMSQSREVQREDVEKQRPLSKMADSLAHLTSPVL